MKTSLRCHEAGWLNLELLRELGYQGRMIAAFNLMAAVDELQRGEAPRQLPMAMALMEGLGRPDLLIPGDTGETVCLWEAMLMEEGAGPEALGRLDTAGIHPLDNLVNVLAVFCNYNERTIGWPPVGEGPGTSLSLTEAVNLALVGIHLCLYGNYPGRFKRLIQWAAGGLIITAGALRPRPATNP